MSKVEKAGRIGQIVIGLVYLVSGAIKVWEPVLFYWEALPYTEIIGVDKENWTTVARWALVMGPLEFALGLGLLLNWRPKIIMPVSSALMAFFVVLTAKAWKQGATIDCGCFGALVDRSPGEAAVEDIIMLGILLFAWWALRGRAIGGVRATMAVAVGTALAVIITGVRFFPESDRLDTSDFVPGVQLTGLGLKGEGIDLSQGNFLIEVFSPTCGRCQKAVPKLNKWTASSVLPPIIGLNSYASDSYQLRQFNERFKPKYRIATISRTDLARLLWGSPGYPRLAWIRDGIVVEVWEHNQVPSLEEMEARFKDAS
jgi:hypothetical protein